MRSYYRRAEDVLPADLIEQVYKHCRGGILYFAHRKSVNRVHRDRMIISMYREGKTIYEISEWVLLTRRAVRYILQKAGEYKATSGAAPSAAEASSCMQGSES
jgi:hypothetical protein